MADNTGIVVAAGATLATIIGYALLKKKKPVEGGNGGGNVTLTGSFSIS